MLLVRYLVERVHNLVISILGAKYSGNKFLGPGKNLPSEGGKAFPLERGGKARLAVIWLSRACEIPVPFPQL